MGSEMCIRDRCDDTNENQCPLNFFNVVETSITASATVTPIAPLLATVVAQRQPLIF